MRGRKKEEQEREKVCMSKGPVLCEGPVLHTIGLRETSVEVRRTKAKH